MRFVLSDNSLLTLPKTLAINRIMAEQDYEVVRSPFSTVMTVAGDGLPKAEPFNISGMAYFADGATATQWIFDLRDALPNIEYLISDDFFINVAYVDFIVVPTLLTRILKVTMKVYPSNTMPNFYEWPAGLLHEYRFDDGPGSSIVTDYASGANGTIVDSPGGMYWNQFGLVFDNAGYVALPSSIGTTLAGLEDSDGWSQVIVTNIFSGVLVGRSTSGTNRTSGFIGEVSTNLAVNVGTGSFSGISGFVGAGVRAIYLGRNPGASQGVFRNLSNDAGLNFASASAVGTPYTDPTIGLGYFGNATPVRLVGTVYYALYFNRYLLLEEREAVYVNLKLRLLERGIEI